MIYADVILHVHNYDSVAAWDKHSICYILKGIGPSWANIIEACIKIETLYSKNA